MILLLIFPLIMILGYFANIFFENKFRCSYCGSLFFKRDSWNRRGMLGHPENIVNICNHCHSDKWWKEKNGWKKIKDKSDGPLSWTEYTDHDGMVYIIYDMMTNPATPDAYMKTDEDEVNKN